MQPMTFAEFNKKFATEEQCRDYLYQVKWPDGFMCPKCNHDSAWKVGDMLYECTQCRRQTSLTAGTIFHGTHKPLQIWFTAIWWIASQGEEISVTELRQILGLGSYKTAWTWLRKIRATKELDALP